MKREEEKKRGKREEKRILSPSKSSTQLCDSSEGSFAVGSVLCKCARPHTIERLLTNTKHSCARQPAFWRFVHNLLKSRNGKYFQNYLLHFFFLFFFFYANRFAFCSAIGAMRLKRAPHSSGGSVARCGIPTIPGHGHTCEESVSFGGGSVFFHQADGEWESFWLGGRSEQLASSNNIIKLVEYSVI